jgi:hypothetical protein
LLQAIDKKAIQNLTYFDEQPDDDRLTLNFPFIRLVFDTSGNQRRVTVDVEPQNILTLACNGQIFSNFF